MQTVDASHGGVVFGIMPIATALVAVMITHERPRPLFWIASFAGAALVIAFALRQGGGALSAGDLLLFAAVVVSAIGYAYSGRLTSQMPGWEVISWVLVIALPISIPATAADHARPTSPTSPLKPWLALLYVTLFSQWIGFFAWNAGLAMGGIARVAQVQLLQPFVTFALAPFFNDETITLQILLFAAGVVATVAISTRTRGAQGARSSGADIRCRGHSAGNADLSGASRFLNSRCSNHRLNAGLQRRREVRDVPGILNAKPGPRRQPEHRQGIGDQSRAGTQQHRLGVAEALKHAGAHEVQSLRDEVQRDHLQEQDRDRQCLGVAGEAAEQQPWLPLRKYRESDHHHGDDHRRPDESLPHARGVAGAEILSGDRSGGDSDRQRRHLDQAEHARPDAEAGLRRRAEIAKRVIDHAHPEEDDRELAAGRQTDIENALPLPELRTNLRGIEADITLEPAEIDPHHQDAHQDRDRTRKARARDAERIGRCPSLRSGPAPARY